MVSGISVVITSAFRTPLGAFGGNFKSVSSVDLGAAAIRKVTEGECVKAKVDSVYMGCVLSAGLGQSAARQAAISAGLDVSIRCANINKICGSGMAAIMMARNAIISGEADVLVAGGMESMSNAPYLLDKARFGYRFNDGKIVDHMVKDGLLDAYSQSVMGLLAENAVKKYEFTREEQDEYTRCSFSKARKAVEDGSFSREVVPVSVKVKKSEKIIDKDEVPFSVDLEKMPSLRPAFKEGGTITAASASSISDGAAAVLVMSEEKAKELGLNPIVRIVAQSSFSQDPSLFATAPVGAIKEVLRKSQWTADNVDVFEINEAFAVVAMSAMKEYSIPAEKVNIFGGACALGHPLGASGARIVVTLLNAMQTRGAKRGLATLCVGGGEAVAMTFEKI